MYGIQEPGYPGCTILLLRKKTNLLEAVILNPALFIVIVVMAIRIRIHVDAYPDPDWHQNDAVLIRILPQILRMSEIDYFCFTFITA